MARGSIGGDTAETAAMIPLASLRKLTRDTQTDLRFLDWKQEPHCTGRDCLIEVLLLAC